MKSEILQSNPADLSIGGLMVTGLMLRSTLESDPLPSWNNTDAKKRIIQFVGRVTRRGSTEFVPRLQRIATFDNDGTLWPEQPTVFQLAFAIDRVKALAPQHPEWSAQQPFSSLMKGDVASALESGDHALSEITSVAHSGLTHLQFQTVVQEWASSTLHPRFNRPYTECIYQPMLEVLSYLRTHGFKTYLISGTGVDFMRAWVPDVYGILPEEVVGGMMLPMGNHRFIEGRPIAAFGNFRADGQVPDGTASDSGLQLALLIGNNSSESGLRDAWERGWTPIDMKSDWKTIFPK